MNKFPAFLALGLALVASLPAAAGVGTIDNVPAATLLLPHFQVDTANATGIGTSFTIGNSDAAERLAHVTLWTDRGVATRTFDVRLPPRGVAEINLRTLFTAGTVPASSPGGFASCAASLPAPPLPAADLTALRNAHTGQASTLFANQCGGSAVGDGIARGYVTVDVVASCGTAVPGDAGYFVNGGTGIARNDNVLWGQYSLHDPANGVAYGDTLVHIEASATDPDTDGTPSPVFTGFPPVQTGTRADYTFYGRRVGGSGADNREALPQVWMGQYSLQDVIARTSAVVWRDPGVVAPFACGAPPAGLAARQVVAFDQQENPTNDADVVALPLASQMRSLDDPAQAAIPFDRGVLYYNLGLPASTAPFEERNQGMVSHLYGSSFGGLALSPAWPLIPIAEAYSYDLPVGGGGSSLQQCRDGIDNDSDGLVDFPADSDCTSQFDNLEAIGRCDDGVDNDGDGLIDFPADLGCRFPADQNEFNPACIDGVDNDADGQTDFPADAGCRAASSEIENPVCSDGSDNDSDSFTDFPNDPQCFSATDNDESGAQQCDDGIDNDGDGLLDFPADPECDFQSEDLEALSVCSDGVDNDGDTLIDFPADLGCTSATDTDETNPQCVDGIDNDGDTLIDFPADIGCSNANDTSEQNAACSDGMDNDADGLIDFPNDPGCENLLSNNERPQCNDGNDNDGDGLTDFPADPSCSAGFDTNESVPFQCGDGIDNDGDGLTDFPNETGCSAAGDNSEVADCAVTEQSDNDLDGLVDFGADPGCASATDLNELAGSILRQCSDGIDNDGNGTTDFPADAGCGSAYDDVEFTTAIKAPTLDVLPDTLPAQLVGGVPFSQALTLANGVAPSSFAVTTGTLPPGLTLTSAGLLAGTPTTPGTFAFTVTGTDGNGLTATQDYVLVVVPPTIVLQPTSLPGSQLSVPYSQVITATGGTGPYVFTVGSGLPPGLTLAPDGTLSGTPNSPGSFAFTVTATDVNGFTGTAAYRIQIGATVIPALSLFNLLLLVLSFGLIAGITLRRD